jgi:hypothetical protein
LVLINPDFNRFPLIAVEKLQTPLQACDDLEGEYSSLNAMACPGMGVVKAGMTEARPVYEA